jgi:hypothetical protein
MTADRQEIIAVLDLHLVGQVLPENWQSYREALADALMALPDVPSTVDRDALGRALGDAIVALESRDESLLSWAHCKDCRQVGQPCPCSGDPMACDELIAAALDRRPDVDSKQLAETATELGRRLGRKEAAEEIAAALEVRDGGHDAAKIAREIAQGDPT